MKDEAKTKEQLINELGELRQRVAELEAADTKQVWAEERLEHLNLVLRAIRRVNQLITRERDRDRLLQGACDRLIETRGYYNAWIALLDEVGGLVTTAEAGLGEAFLPMVEWLKRGELIACRQRLSQPGVVVTKDPPSACADCPLSASYRGRGAITARLEYGGKVYGLLSTSIPAHLTADGEEQVLFGEVARDIAFALHDIELEEERQRAEEALELKVKQLATLGQASQAMTASLELDQVLAEIVSLASEVVASDYTSVVLVDKAGHLGESAENLPGVPAIEYRIRDKGFTNWIVRSRQEVIIDEIGEDGAITPDMGEGAPRFANPPIVKAGVKSVAGLPLMVKDRLLGVLYLHSLRAGAFHGQLPLLTTFANQAAIATENARLYEAVQRELAEQVRAERLLRALNQAAIAMERALTPEEIFTTVARELKKLGFSCIVFLTDESQSRLFIKHWSYEARAIEVLEKLTGLKIENFSIPIETSDVYRIVVQERKAAFIENVEDVTRQFLPKSLKKFAAQIVRMLKIAKSIPAPLIVEDKVIGLLSVESDDLTERDIPAITAFAHQMAAAWRKARLLQELEQSLTEQTRAQEELQQSFKQLRRALEGTVNTLVSAIELRDPYTAGHQRRVTQLACAIAQEMGLAEEQTEGIRMAGLIHDIGKINVPAEILSKPGPLTELEFGLIKMHPKTGYDVLNGAIEFPWPLAQIVLQHHERMDGSGYPQGLSGREIILEARILGVADVVEAMASHRPYRSARGIDEALEEISQKRGILYDPEVVDACVKLFTEKGFTFEQGEEVENR